MIVASGRAFGGLDYFTLVAALLHLTPHAWRHAWHLDALLDDRFLTFAAIALPAVGTALAGVRGHFEFKKIATRSRMIALHIDGLIEDEDLRYAIAYALFKTGEVSAAEEHLSALNRPDLFRKAAELRRAIQDCAGERWKCL